MRWSPAQYERFAGPRLQPGLDLLRRLPELDARRAVDLGCGGGALTALLAERYPAARVVGVDSSEQMLERARRDWPALDWERADLATWTPEVPQDVLFSNAALHWLDDHAALFPRLVSHLAPGGALAVQVPNNFAAPSHTLIREVAALPRFAGRVPLRAPSVLSLAAYHALLSPRCAKVELWETEYLHALEGEDPVLEWVRGTTLLPVLAALPGAELDAFVAEYAARLRQAYPRGADGRTLFPFKRVFILAIR